MRTRIPMLLVGGAPLIAVAAALLIGGGPTVTRGRLERSIEQSFPQRYIAQAKLLGRTGITPASLHTHAFCDKGGPAVADHGPGADWNCYLNWTDPNVPLSDGSGKFEMNVHANGCYTAGGPSKLTGLATLTSSTGATVDNPVFEWDSCFDPTGTSTRNPPAGAPATVSLPTGLVPISSGVAGPELTCSAGAVGGCIGTLTATIKGRTVFSTVYQLPPKGSNSFSFPVPDNERALGTPLTLTVRPFLGGATRATSDVKLGPPTD